MGNENDTNNGQDVYEEETDLLASDLNSSSDWDADTNKNIEKNIKRENREPIEGVDFTIEEEVVVTKKEPEDKKGPIGEKGKKVKNEILGLFVQDEFKTQTFQVNSDKPE